MSQVHVTREEECDIRSSNNEKWVTVKRYNYALWLHAKINDWHVTVYMYKCNSLYCRTHVIKIILRYKAEHVSSPTYTANRPISHGYKALGNGKKKFNLNAISVVSFPYASLPS